NCLSYNYIVIYCLFFIICFYLFFFFFFFQAEDGIRDKLVTGVQTCALPISHAPILTPGTGSSLQDVDVTLPPFERFYAQHRDEVYAFLVRSLGRDRADDAFQEIGRASCRERVEIWVAGASLKRKRKCTSRSE